MTCHYCRTTCKRFGKHRNGLQRFRCNQCSKTFTEDHERPLDEMRLPLDRAVSILSLLVEGMSVRSVERVTGVHRDTILRLLVLAGNRCERMMHQKIEHLTVGTWSVTRFGAMCSRRRDTSARAKKTARIGDAYCFVAMERTSKLVLAFHLGRRNRVDTEAFLSKLRYATSHQRFQLSTDGFQAYSGCDLTLQDRVDYAQIIKVYGARETANSGIDPQKSSARRKSQSWENPIPRSVCNRILKGKT